MKKNTFFIFSIIVGVSLIIPQFALAQAADARKSATLAGEQIRELKAKPSEILIRRVSSFQVLSANLLHIGMIPNHQLRADLVFNKAVDAGSISVENNFRILRHSFENGAVVWRDAFSTPGTLVVNGTHVTWTSDGPYPEGTYKIHLRGTIKATDGSFLDCDGDGTPEGGNLPAFESSETHLVF